MKYSILDLCPVCEGQTAADALRHSADLAQHAERWGYERFWLAEHHNMPGIASAATSVVIGHVAAATSTLRVGAGGIMLPNHSPLVIAEQFGTLEALYPGRIELGLGRAPGTDPATARALRRSQNEGVDQFPRDVQTLLDYFDGKASDVVPTPGLGSGVPIWILGSSLFGAQLAAALGLPYAFASHFAPTDLMAAIACYRENFRPSQYLDKPYLMVGFTLMAAETDKEAEYHASTVQQGFLNLYSGKPTKFPAPKENFWATLDEGQRHLLGHVLACSAIGSKDKVTDKLALFLEKTQPDEVMLTCTMHSHEARLRSLEIGAEVLKNYDDQ